MFAALASRFAPYKLIAGLVVIGSLVAAIGVQTVRLALAEASIETKSAVISGLQAQLDTQNAGIEAMKAEASRRQEASSKAVARATKAAADAAKAARELASAQIPEDCAGAMRHLAEAGPKLGAQP